MVRAGDAALIRIAGERPATCSSAPPPTPERSGRPPPEAGAVEADPIFGRCTTSAPGLPTVLPETADAFVPQMANMQHIDGVSFHKGCYTGQEVVARMQYLGKLKRRMYIAEVDTDARSAEPRRRPERPRQQLRAGARAGRRCPRRAPGHWEMLVVAEIAAAEGGGLDSATTARRSSCARRPTASATPPGPGRGHAASVRRRAPDAGSRPP
jgi:folate-binding protein YgfZ